MRCFFLAIHVTKRHLVLYIDVEFITIFFSSLAVSSLAVNVGQSACLISRPIQQEQQLDCDFPTSRISFTVFHGRHILAA